jgi:folate-binding protein YgfZ
MLKFYRFRQDYLKFEGNDRLDLVNRLSTNRVDTLQKYSGIKTVLTNDKGRIIDLISLFNFGDFIFAACSLNNSVNVLAHLDKYTIMDDFRAINMTGTHETILFFGDESDKFSLDKFGIELSGKKNNDFDVFKSDAKDTIISRNDDSFGGFKFIYPSEDKNIWNDFFFSGHAESSVKLKEITGEHYETERIIRGIPAYGKEMSENTNPLECGLNDYVSFTKGCYIGQEVIARMDAYDKISRHMIKIRSDKPFSSSSKIVTDGKECGFVTSAVRTGDNKYAGLGFIKTIFLESENKFLLKYNDSQTECKIFKLEK